MTLNNLKCFEGCQIGGKNTTFNFRITDCISFMISLPWWKWKLLTLGTQPTVLLITVLLLIDFLKNEPEPAGHYLLDLSPTCNAVLLILHAEFSEWNVWFSEQRYLCMEQIRTSQFKLYSNTLILWKGETWIVLSSVCIIIGK